MLSAITVTSLSDDTLGNLAGDGQVSLREAVEAANTDTSVDGSTPGSGADTIDFDPSLSGGTITLAGTQLTISDDLTIDGLGSDQLAISGDNLSRVFSVSAEVPVILTGMSITHGSASGGGGILNEGRLTLENSSLTDNTGTDYGGAIRNVSGDLTLTNTTLSGNTTYYQGGAIWSNGSLDMTGSALFENYSDWEGGAIWNSGTLDVTDSALFENNSYWEGGAIWNSGTLEITEGDFSDNYSTWNGGAIANREGGIVTIADSFFVRNEAGPAFFTRGGAIDGYRGGQLDVSNSFFTENYASTGGAIWNDAPATIVGSTFLRNSAGMDGGAIRLRWETIRITDCTLTDNSARNDGGAIENYYGTVELINSTISGNSAGRFGGAVDNWGGTVNSTNATIVMNRADADGNGSGTGGGIYNYNTSSVTLLNNTLLGGNLLGVVGSDSPNDLAGFDVNPGSAHNLIGDAATAGGLTDGVNGNIVGNSGTGTIAITTVLDPNLADNGGTTLTHALVPGGLAVNAGDNSKAVDGDGNPLAYDQRDEGFARIVDGTVDIGAFEIPPPQLVEIDIKPGGDPNAINLASNGRIAVAIFTTDDFDAGLVDATTVTFAGASAVHSALEDIDGDGDLDMVLHFQVEDTDLAYIYAQLLAEDADSTRQSLAVSLAGKTTDNTAFEGTDGVDMFFSGKALRELLDELALAGVL